MLEEKVRIKGGLLSVIVLLIIIPIIIFIYLLKVNMMGEVIKTDPISIIHACFWFFIILISGLVIHELIKVMIYKIYKIKGIKIKIKNSMFFLYSKEPIKVYQAKKIWIIPFLILTVVGLIGIVVYPFYIAISISIVIVSISDDLIIYLKLLKYASNDIFVQEEDFLGFQIIDSI